MSNKKGFIFFSILSPQQNILLSHHSQREKLADHIPQESLTMLWAYLLLQSRAEPPTDPQAVTL